MPLQIIVTLYSLSLTVLVSQICFLATSDIGFSPNRTHLTTKNNSSTIVFRFSYPPYNTILHVLGLGIEPNGLPIADSQVKSHLKCYLLTTNQGDLTLTFIA